MNRTALKNYAPVARWAFIQAVTDRAAYYGLTSNKIEPISQKGDVAVIGGREHPRVVVGKRKQLEERIKRHGFKPTMEAIAYTWFNRLVAIRFMELHGYLDHGFRVLSHPEGKPTPEILEQAEHVALPGLKHDVVIDLKLAGNKEGELYRLLLTAQCNALHTAMPFLFERIDDETELLLPDNLLHSDSLIRKLVSEIDEQDWQQVEILGWLYQFYISEKKGEVIGKVVANEDIPAATQLFTPNWIVKYLVQNTLGRQWLATYPQSALRLQMKYYIEPSEQTPEVRDQLKKITPPGLNPEGLTLLDPACGSGHILVEAYDLFKAIYQERGYRAKDIPALILQKNLFGLEIDDRAAQLAAFALMMKARADDRRIFDSYAKPNILAFEDSRGMNASDITHALNSPINKEDVPSEYLFEEIQEDEDGLCSKKALAEKSHVSQVDIASLLDLFENAKTFGSLIQVPSKLTSKLSDIEKRLDDVLKRGDLTHTSAHVLKPLIQQARILARQYDAVVANPPYMGAKYHSPDLKRFAGTEYGDSKYDTYAMFIQRGMLLVRPATGLVGLIVMETWMLAPSYDEFRRSFLLNSSLSLLLHMPYEGRGNTVMGISFGLTAFTASTEHLKGTVSTFYVVRHTDIDCDGVPPVFPPPRKFTGRTDDFAAIPSHPIAYWISDPVKNIFLQGQSIADVAETASGLQTSDNQRFLRQWHEVAWTNIGFEFESRDAAKASGLKWFPHKKGGPFQKWYGNDDFVVNWENDGAEAYEFARSLYGSPTRIIKNAHLYFRQGVTWSHTSSAKFSARLMDTGFIFNVEGPSLFADSPLVFLGYLCSKPCWVFIQVMNSTLHFLAGSVSKLPFLQSNVMEYRENIERGASEAVMLARKDWHSQESAWGFQRPPMLEYRVDLASSYAAVAHEIETQICRLKELEEENNRCFIRAFGLENEMDAEVPIEEITHRQPNRQQNVKELLSYAIGCMMGRYSLDKPGLIYAHRGNQEFDSSQYRSFPVDDDGIIPLLETDWGIGDDAANRTVEFIRVVWPQQHLDDNLKFIAGSLGPPTEEQPRETIRRYFAIGFYKHHLSMYKRRPIYWLFSSGKQRAFQCLVYLHRYHEGTLARMRTEYVIPLQGQIAARIERLEADKVKATSTSHRNKLQKEQTDLKKQQAELLIFEEKLKHVADQKIMLDLDDGVKVNYAKFGDLLAESKAITGEKDDE